MGSGDICEQHAYFLSIMVYILLSPSTLPITGLPGLEGVLLPC